ncbi:MAG: hypothetical protein ACFCU8_13960 [Thermosynechococcaceae cyanobacterium]
MKSKNILILALGIAVIPAAALFANQSQTLEAKNTPAAQSEPSEPQIIAASPDENAAVQEVMKAYVNQLTADDELMPIIYQGKVLQLQLATSEKYPDGFHAGVQNKGSLYTSCADFVDPKTGNKYDIDFLVSKDGDTLTVVQPFVHSVNGEKNPYDLAH